MNTQKYENSLLVKVYGLTGGIIQVLIMEGFVVIGLFLFPYGNKEK